MEVTRHGHNRDGYVFFSPADQKGKEGTYELSGTGFIMKPNGDMIYASEETGYSFCDEWVAGMTDFRPQKYDGKPHITYWNGCNTQGAHWGHRWGRVTFIDEDYRNFTINPDLGVNTLDDANKGQIDVHEHQMTDDGTMVSTSYNNTKADLSTVGGSSDAWVADSMFFEFDVKTGEVLFQWRAMDHLPLRASRMNLGRLQGTKHIPWDWFHINSVQKIGKNYLISARHHWAIYLISGEDGSVIWKLDGIDGGDFGTIPAEFRWQHHVRAHNVTESGMTVSVFNNMVNGEESRYTQSRALAYYLHMPVDTAHPPLLVRWLHTENERLFSGTQGSYQMEIGNGHGFVGYGKTPVMREYGPAEDGSDLRWQARFGYEGAAMSYRAFKAEWHGIPKDWDPVVLFEPVRLQQIAPAKVYVSWNGATDITDWVVFGGDGPDDMHSIGLVDKAGFETTFSLNFVRCVQLGAVHDGKIIRASNVACQDDDITPGHGAGFVDDSHTSVTDVLNAEIQALKDELNNREGGVWVSYRLFLEVTCSVIGLCIGIWLFRFWRERRRRKAFTGVLGTESYYKHRRLDSIGLGVFSGRHDKSKTSPMVPIDATDFDESKLDDVAASDASRRRRGTYDEPFGLADDDEDNEEDALPMPAGAQAPVVRLDSGS